MAKVKSRSIVQSKSTTKRTSRNSQSTSTTKVKASRNVASKPQTKVKAGSSVISKQQTNVKASGKLQSNTVKTASKNTIFQFKITLRGMRPFIWRRIQISKDTTFQNFHLAIVNSMGWANSHNHGFESPDTEIVPVYSLDLDMPDNRKRVDEAKIKLSDYFRNPKDWIMHMYDYGDGWEHAIHLEKILPVDHQKKYPVCLDGKRACPPDDCGGVYGFREHCKIMSDPKHPEYKETKKWLKGIGLENWKADVFNPESVKFRCY